METILRSDALKLIDIGEPFTMEYVQADRRRGTGGVLVEVKNWVKHGVQTSDVRRETKDNPSNFKPQTLNPKDPNHYRNGTINIKNPTHAALHIHKLHTALMLTFNGKKIING